MQSFVKKWRRVNNFAALLTPVLKKVALRGLYIKVGTDNQALILGQGLTTSPELREMIGLC